MSSKLNIGSVIWNATTGVEQGTILHSNALKTVNGTSLVGSGDLETQLTSTLLGSRNSVGDITIAPSNGLDSILTFRASAYSTADSPTTTVRLGDVGTNTTYMFGLYTDNSNLVRFYRNADGTTITIHSIVNSLYSLYINELKVV